LIISADSLHVEQVWQMDEFCISVSIEIEKGKEVHQIWLQQSYWH
jgi:hypothetical protein